MEWVRAHPYIAALCTAATLTLVGGFIVVSRASQPAGTRPSTWGGEAIPLLNPTASEKTGGASRDDRTSPLPIQSGPPYTYIAPNFSTSLSPEEETSYDFAAFVDKLAKESASKGQPETQSDSGLLSAYAYIPRGLISTTTSRSTRTALQQELYDYGNDIGSTIESYEQQHSNTVQILKGQVEDRGNPEKAAAVARIGRDLQEMGKNLAAMETVPSAISSAHDALAKSYVEIGKNLALIPGAERDSDFIAAIQAYNTSADTFTKNYIQLVSLLGAHGVTFTASDPGKVFTFSPTGF